MKNNNARKNGMKNDMGRIVKSCKSWEYGGVPMLLLEMKSFFKNMCVMLLSMISYKITNYVWLLYLCYTWWYKIYSI